MTHAHHCAAPLALCALVLASGARAQTGAPDAATLFEKGVVLAKKTGDSNAQADAARDLLHAAEMGHPSAGDALFGLWAALPREWREPMLGVFAENPRGFQAMIQMCTSASPGAVRSLAESLSSLREQANKEGPELRLLLYGTAPGAPPEIDTVIQQTLTATLGAGAPEQARNLFGAPREELPMAMGQLANAARQGNAVAARILAFAARDPDPEVRTKAAEWLGANAATEATALAAVQRMAADPDPNIRQSAAYALNAVSSRRPELLKILLAAAKDPEPSVRQTAVIGLAADAIRRNAAATDALIAATKDSDPVVQLKAVEGLGNAIAAGNDKARSFLKTLAASRDPNLARKADAYLRKYPLRK